MRKWLLNLKETQQHFLHYYHRRYRNQLISWFGLATTMKTIYALGIILLAVTANVALSCRIETDGCSAPAKNVPFIDVFTPACVRHDICYRCVSTDFTFRWKLHNDRQGLSEGGGGGKWGNSPQAPSERGPKIYRLRGGSKRCIIKKNIRNVFYISNSMRKIF